MKSAAKFYVLLNTPGRGIFSFGGWASSITTSQQLSTIDGAWTYGPNLYQLQSDYGHCAVQVSCHRINHKADYLGKNALGQRRKGAYECQYWKKVCLQKIKIRSKWGKKALTFFLLCNNKKCVRITRALIRSCLLWQALDYTIPFNLFKCENLNSFSFNFSIWIPKSLT